MARDRSPDPPADRPTIRDVARAAGVSYQTVSRAINDASGIDPATRVRVLAVADELGYRPSRLARSLATGRTQTIGLIVTAITNPFFSHVTQAVIDAAEAASYRVMILSTNWTADSEAASLQTAVSHGVDGIVAFVDHVSDARVRQIVGDLPVVLVNRWSRPTGIPTLNVDRRGGTQAAVEHLVALGHRNIGMLDMRPGTHEDTRHRTFRTALRGHGIAIDESWIVREEGSAEGGRRAARDLLAAHPEVTAIFAFNDVMAVGSLGGLDQAGRRVPEDCAVIGFDGVQLCELTRPPLSTIAVDFDELARTAVDIVATWRSGRRTPTDPLRGVLKTRLIVRESTVGS